MIAEIFKTIIDWYMININYGTIALLMGLESTIIPFPSELIVPPAAWKAAHGELNFFGVIISASAGALCGSLFNYFCARTLGRPILYKIASTKWAHLMLFNAEHLVKAENYFKKHGNLSTFLGRLVPVIRHLISIPAGISRMNIKQFCLYTILGATLWNIILTMLGVFLYNQKDQLEKYYHYISYILLGAGILFIVFLIHKGIKKTSKIKSTPQIESNTMISENKIAE